MTFKITNISVILFITTVLNLFTTTVAWQRRKTKGGAYFAWGMAGVTLWTLASSLDYAAVPIPTKVFYAKIEALGSYSALSLLTMFALSYAGHDDWLKKSWVKAFFILYPFTSIALTWTNEFHNLIWSGFTRSDVGDNIVIFHHGPVFTGAVIVGYAMIALILITLWQASRQGSELSRRQARLLLMALSFPMISNLLYLLEIQTLQGIDWTSITFSFSGVFVLIAIYGTHFLNLIPIARYTTIERMSDCVLVLDGHNRVIDFNQAAAETFEIAEDQISNPLEEVITGWPEMIAFACSPSMDTTQSITLHGQDETVFDARMTLLKDNRGQLFGKLLVFRDISKQYQAERALAERVKELNSIYNLSLLVESPDISLEEILQGSVNLIAAAMQYPQLACAKLSLGDRVFVTENYQDTPMKLIDEVSVSGRGVGTLEVCYLEDPEEGVRPGFMEEEKNLLYIMTERLGDVIQNVQAEERLRQSEANFREVFENTAHGIFVIEISPEGEFRIGNSNPAEQEATTIRREDVIGKTLTEAFPAEIAEILEINYSRCLEAGESITYEEEINLPGVGRRVFLTTLAPVRDETGRFYRIIGSTLEITNRKRMEELNRFRLELWEYSTAQPLNALMQKALDEICELTESPLGFYHFVDEDQKTLSLQAWSTRTLEEYCQAEGEGLHYDIDEAGVWVEAFHQRKPVTHNDYAAVPHRKGMPKGHAEIRRQLVAPTLREGRVVSLLGVGNKPTDYNHDDIELVSSAADLIWTMVSYKQAEEELEHTQAQLVEQQRELARNEERQRMARDLHDSVNQSLHSLNLFSETLVTTIGKENFERAQQIARRVQESARQSFKETRLMLHELQDSGPGRDINFIEDLETRLRRVERRAGVRAKIIQEGSPLPCPQELHENLYWIAIEALNNILKHAQASQVQILIRCTPQRTEMEIVDDGIGFDASKPRHSGMGLETMRQRAALLNGELTVESTPGEGTCVRLTVGD